MLIIYLGQRLLVGSSGSYNGLLAGTSRLNSSNPFPCSRQGLPFLHVTVQQCELLPRSFHPYQQAGGLVSVALSLGFTPGRR